MKALLLCLLVTNTAFAQLSDQEAVGATIDRMFDGMRTIDTTMFKSVFAPNATLKSIVKNKEGLTSVQETPISIFIASIAKQKNGALDERLYSYTAMVDGDMAVAWTPYGFYYNGQPSHCGVNSFTLVRLNNEWKILSIIDTRRKCE